MTTFGEFSSTGGGLFGSSNTNTNTNTGGSALFGSNQQQAANSPFGSAQNPVPTTGGFGFGNQSSPGTGMFGSSTGAGNTSGNMFGNTGPMANTTTGTGFGFGNTGNPTTSNTFGSNTSSNLFGAPSGATGNANTAISFGAKPTGSLGTGTGPGFGFSGNQQATTMGTGFGNTANTGFGTSNPSTGFNFGSSAANWPAATGFGGFGSTANTAAPSTGLFAGQSSAAKPFGGFGTQPSLQLQNPQIQLQQQAQIPVITPFSRPIDLPENFQKELEALDNYITSQTRIGETLKAKREIQEELILSIPRDVELLTRKFSTAAEALKYDDTVLTEIKKLSDEVVSEAEICFELLSNLRNPSSNLFSSVYGATHGPKLGGDVLLPYFKKKVEQFERTIQEYSITIAEIEKAIESAEGETTEGPGNANNIVATLQEEHRLFMTLGNKVAELHHSVGRLESKK